MGLHNKTKPSVYLILLSAVILLLGIALVYFSQFTEKVIKHDARVINEAGIVRGSIQRATKLLFVRKNGEVIELMSEVQESLSRFFSMEGKYYHVGPDSNAFEMMDKLNTQWQSLERSMVQYQMSPTQENKSSVVALSELCWDVAIEAVLVAQKETEYKVGLIKKIFYVIILLNGSSAISVMFLVFMYVRRKLEHETAHDQLTGLHNRRAYVQAIVSEVALNQRYQIPLSLVMVDIDYFKQINDTCGHKKGDDVLISTAKVLAKSIRKTDLVYRIGGEEFAIIAPGTNAEGAKVLAESVRKKVEEIKHKGLASVTISLGVAELLPEWDEDKLFFAADKALYEAKEKGRNRTEVYLPSIPPQSA